MRDTLVDLIRHGEPTGGRRYRGNGADDPPVRGRPETGGRSWLSKVKDSGSLLASFESSRPRISASAHQSSRS